MGALGITVGVLGPLEVRVAGRDACVDGRNARALLVALALRAGEQVPVTSLVDLLWGEAPPRTAVQSVRNAVSHLRRVLRHPDAGVDASLIATVGCGYRLGLDRAAVDAHRFRDLATAGRDAAKRRRYVQAATTFREALSIWRGGSVAELGDTPAARAEVGYLTEERLAVLEDRIDAELAVGLHGELVGELSALVELHPFRERLWGHLMVALYRCGRQADALAVFRRARDMLVGELGLEPSPALRELESMIITHHPGLVPATAVGPAVVSDETPPPAPHDGRPVATPPAVLPEALRAGRAEPFVGRQRQLASLAEVWAEASQGRTRVVLVDGEPGVGKTALAARFAGEVLRAGGMVLYGRCDEGAGVDHQPLREALRWYCCHCRGGDLGERLGPFGGQLSQLVPELALATTGARHDPSVEEGDFLLFEAVAGWLATASRRMPILLVLDDLHWATPASLRLIRHLSRVPNARLAILATFRSTDVPPGVARLLYALPRDPGVTCLRLDGFEDIELIALVEAVTDNRLGSGGRDLIAGLRRATAGNPFFVTEMLTEAVRVGGAYRGPDRPWRLPTDTLPRSIHDFVASRLSSLAPGTRQLLRMAAVVADEFDLPVLAAVADLTADDALVAAEEATAAGLIREVGCERYRFAHAVVRSALREAVGLTRRARLEHRIHETLNPSRSWAGSDDGMRDDHTTP